MVSTALSQVTHLLYRLVMWHDSTHCMWPIVHVMTIVHVTAIVLVTHCSRDSLFLWLIVLVTHCSRDSLFSWLIVLVTTIVVVTLLFCSTISTVHLWPYSLRLDFLYPMVQNNRVLPIHPLSDPFKVFLLYLKYSRVTTSHQKLSKSPLDLALGNCMWLPLLFCQLD